MKTKRQISCAVTAQLISTFAFVKHIVQFLFYLCTKFQASSFILFVSDLVGNPNCWFSHAQAQITLLEGSVVLNDHYENLPMQNTEICLEDKNNFFIYIENLIFLIFSLKIYILGTCYNHLGKPQQTPVFYIEELRGGRYRTCIEQSQ